MTALMSAYDKVAPEFDRHRALPDGVAEAVRASILDAVATSPRPRLLDLGAGSGRIGWPFVAAGDDYIGVDLSLGMLRAYVRRCSAENGHVPRLALADGRQLPFPDATFDAVMLIQVFGGMTGWEAVLAEVRRVLRPSGLLMTGRVEGPAQGIDALMKHQLARLLEDMGIRSGRNVWEDARDWLARAATSASQIVAATWMAERTPREFLQRHRTGAHFGTLSEPVKDEALHRLGVWAAATFGSLDAVCSERREFELRLYRFEH